LMGIETIYAKPRTSLAGENARRYPYLLKGMKIDEPNQVWSTDISVPQQRRERWEYGLPQSAYRSRLQTTISGFG